MKINLNKIVLLFACCLIGFSSCKDAWKEHQEVTIGPLNKTILEELAENTSTSEFYKLIIKTKVDKILSESRSFTIWAPNNTNIQQLDNAILENEDALKAFVLNHISYQSYFSKDVTEGKYIRVLNGKNIFFEKTKFEDFAIQTADIFLRNGVLHLIEGSANPKQNALEFLESLNNKQFQYINSLFYEGLDVTNGVILFYDPITGEPVYQEGTTKPVTKNHFLDKVSNIGSEDSLLTYIILSDEAFDYEIAQLEKFNNNSEANLEVRDSLTKWLTVKDLVVNGVFTSDQLSDSLTTTSGVQIKINPSDIISTKLLSNGIAYVVNKVNYEVLENKIPAVKIEGAAIDSARTPAISILKTLKDFNGQIFRQRETGTITSSPSPLNYFRFKTKAYSTRYAIYWRARNTILTVPFKMAVAITSTKPSSNKVPDDAIISEYVEVPVFNIEDPSTLEETFIDYVDITQEGTQYVYLLSSTGATSALPTALALNYIKLVPVN
jgi:uncharacterized ubiquitin-like protein YukD